MFSWLKNFFRSFLPAQVSREERYDLYTPQERLLYRYHDGSKVVAGDPLILSERLAAFGPELSVDISVAGSLSKDNAKAQKELARKIRVIFNIAPPKDEEEIDCTDTLTRVQLFDLLDHFMIYNGWLKKNSRPPVTSSVATSGSSASSSAASPPTSSSTGSGSTASAPSVGPPGPSAKG